MSAGVEKAMVQTAEQQMDLLLWRHAEAEDGNGDDLARQLTGRGAKQAAAVARWILAHHAKRLRILVSPATRARQTADALGLKYEIVDRIGPTASTSDLIAAANWPDAGGSVLLVGHQPTLGRLASHLLFGQETDLAIKKGALWWFARDGRQVPCATELKAVITPSLAD